MTEISFWNSAISTSDIALGISREEAERRALHMLVTLGQDGASLPLSFTEDLPDVLHALVQEMARNESTSEGNYESIRELHQLVAELAWPGDEFGEKAQLLTHISQLAWSRSLVGGSAVEVRHWEEECLKYFLLQDGARQLVEMPIASWSPAVCDRFLSDRPLLLALCVWLNNAVNSNQRKVFDLASVVYNWLSTHRGTDAVREEEGYLLGQLSCALAGALKLLGQYRNSRERLRLAEEWSKGSSNSEALQARIEYLRLAIMSEVHQDPRVLLHVPGLIERFQLLGLEEEVAKAKFLHAGAQKQRGFNQQALASFSVLRTDPAVLRQPWFKALVLVNLADLQNRTCDLATSLCSIKEAEALLQGTGMSFAQAHCCSVTAEILRDHGNPSASGEYYRRAIEIYSDVGMAVFAAYTRLLLAETLVATGRADEAVDEIVAALPVIEREQLVREGIAAVALLKASLTRRHLDSEALKSLRESLDRSRQEVES